MSMHSKMMQMVEEYNSRKFEFNIKDAFYQFEDYILDYQNQEGDKNVLLENKGTDDIYSTADHSPIKGKYINIWDKEFDYFCRAEMGVTKFAKYDESIGLIYIHSEWNTISMEWDDIYYSEVINPDKSLYEQLESWDASEKKEFANFHHARLFRFWKDCAMYYLDCLENSKMFKIHECPHFIDDQNFDQKIITDKFSEYLTLMVRD